MEVESPYSLRPNFQLGNLVTRAYNRINDPIFCMETSEDFSLTTALVELSPTNLENGCRNCVSNTQISVELRRLCDYNAQTLVEIQNDDVFLKEEVRFLAKLKNNIIVRSVETQSETIEIKLPIKVNKNKW